ncbi:MAG TPA: FGGY-family carbohydrate kinase [Ideonella sp.]|uniref:FGGY-family carbohydrate kinase n=1 Tax=Ideonella sp. TaxID=1929293 RepID=UPI002E34E791|nr:FGGY-family carbohydrate kinase [Ideonella sp.]HEX5686417.1 FGGY-family carbohydrate kinase [Ideonella sp.]
MNDPLLLALDCGTQSVRALLIDLHGHIRGKAQQAFDDYVSRHDGWHEHDADTFWRAAAGVCRRVLRDHAHEHAAERVQGITVTTQRGTLLPVDVAGRPLRPFITWLDQRRATRLPRIGPLWRAAFKAAGVAPTIDYFQREAELNWIAEHEPGVLARTHKVLLVSGWLNFRLSGRYADSVASQVGYLPFDFKRQQWAGERDWKWQALTVRRDWMPELLPAGETIGGLTREAAEATGLRAGLPVIAAAADKACEIVGAGAIAPHIGALSYGTTATIDVTTPRYVEAMSFIPPYPALLPGQYNTEVQIFRGYWLVRWFKDQFGHPEIAEGQAAGVSPELLFDRLVAQVPPGSQGLMLQPYWTPGIRHPGPDARGAVIGFSDVHTRAHLYRAILEGLAYALRDGKERIEKRSGTRITELRVSGGGAQSDAAMQLTADIFGLPATRPHTFETSGLGAAIAGAVGLGLYPDFPSAVAAMTRLGRRFDPHPQHHALYDALYHGTYQRMYGRLAPLYAQLRKVLKASA